MHAHLTMATPTSITELLKLPLVSDETLLQESNPGYEALVAEIAHLNQQVATKSTQVTSDRSSRRQVRFQRDMGHNGSRYQSHSRSCDNSRSRQRRDRSRECRDEWSRERCSDRSPKRRDYRPRPERSPYR